MIFQKRSMALIFFVSMSFVFTCAWANSKEKDKELERVRSEIEEKKQQIGKLSSREGSILKELQGFSRSMNDVQARLRTMTARKDALEKEIEQSRKNLQRLEVSIQKKKSDMESSLRSLYVFKQPVWTRVLFSSENPMELRKRRYYLQRWVEADQKKMEEYQRTLEETKRVEAKLSESLRERESVIADLSAQNKKLSQEGKNRKELLALVQNQKDYYKKSVQELERAAKDLQNLIETLRSREKTGEDRFSSLKGKLILPVRGTLEKKFGPYLDSKLQAKLHHKGIDLRAPAGAPVVAVFDGKVAYAGWFTGYGKIVILDHGAGYFTLYAHLDEVLRKEGESVIVGDPIGSVGDTESLKGAYLYFELRQKGISTDPWPWFARR